MSKRLKAKAREKLEIGLVRCLELDETGPDGAILEAYQVPGVRDYRRIGRRGYVQHMHAIGAVAAMYWHPRNLVHRDRNGDLITWYCPQG